LDGELVIETKRGKDELMFLFFDALVIDEKRLIDREYTKRLGVLLVD
jgi:ATP-dependent DNA ligase